MDRLMGATILSLSLFLALGSSRPAGAADLPANAPTAEQLANDNNLFLSLARKALKWEEPAEPVRIAGPIYFVGTKGLGAFIFATSEGLVLMNTGMPSSGPMIEESIRKLGFNPADIKLMINGHAHVDHAGAFAYLKQKYGGTLAVMREDVPAMESGDKSDFKYADDFVYPAVKVDRILRDGDVIRIGDVVLTALLTPGHTRGATTWVADIVVDGKPLLVVFPDGAGFNPGYRLARNPSYPGIGDDYRRTHHRLEMLHPDIWLAQHTSTTILKASGSAPKRRALARGSIRRAIAASLLARSAPSRMRSIWRWASRSEQSKGRKPENAHRNLSDSLAARQLQCLRGGFWPEAAHH